MSDETTLLPCPFCGGEARIFHFSSAIRDEVWRAVCDKPFCAQGPDGSTEAEAIAAWNTRYHSEFEKTVIKAWKEIKDYTERTCKQEERGWGTEGDHARVWLTCGHDCMVPTVQDLPNYCPNCGAKVVG